MRREMVRSLVSPQPVAGRLIGPTPLFSTMPEWAYRDGTVWQIMDRSCTPVGSPARSTEAAGFTYPASAGNHHVVPSGSVVVPAGYFTALWAVKITATSFQIQCIADLRSTAFKGVLVTRDYPTEGRWGVWTYASGAVRVLYSTTASGASTGTLAVRGMSFDGATARWYGPTGLIESIAAAYGAIDGATPTGPRIAAIQSGSTLPFYGHLLGYELYSSVLPESEIVGRLNEMRKLALAA